MIWMKHNQDEQIQDDFFFSPDPYENKSERVDSVEDFEIEDVDPLEKLKVDETLKKLQRDLGFPSYSTFMRVQRSSIQ